MSETSVNFSELFKIKVPESLDFKAPILVVDSQQDLRLIVVHQLKKLGFVNVLNTSHPKEAFDIIKSQDALAAILYEFSMPGVSGVEFLQELKVQAELPRSPFIMIMENVDKEKLMLAVEGGTDEILVKPFTLGDIVPKIKTAFKKFNNPRNPEQVYELAKRHLRNEDYDAAMNVFEALAKANPTAARPLVGLAQIFVAKNDLAKALEYLKQAEERNDAFVHIFSVRGRIFAQQKKFDEAFESYKYAIELSPLNAYRYQEASAILIEQQRYEDTVKLLKMAIEKDIAFSELYHQISTACYALKDFKAASRYIKKALESDPENVTFLNQLGICLKEQGEFEAAIKIYNQVIKMDPKNMSALYNKAITLKTKGDLEEAIKLLTRVTETFPEFAAAKKKLTEFKSAASSNQGEEKSAS